jgi:hypothetical protein
MLHLGYERKIVRLLQILDWFRTLVGVLQGCVLSPLLFCVFLEVVTARALDVEEQGVTISGLCINNMKFADDIALVAESEEVLQTMLKRIDAESHDFGLTISTAKTVVQCIPPRERRMTASINGVMLEQTTEFVYLGGRVTEDATSDSDIDRRIGLATGVACSLIKLWRSKDISSRTKVRLYKSLVLSVLLYNSETWTMREALNRKLLVFEMSVLRRIMGVTRRDRCRNEDVRRQLGVNRDVVNEIRHRRLGYFGHVVRMSQSRTPNLLLYGRIRGNRPRGRPYKRWLDGIQEDCKIAGITVREVEYLARDRRLWSRAVYRLLERVDRESGSSSPMH